jgi:hypothetical protein
MLAFVPSGRLFLELVGGNTLEALLLRPVRKGPENTSLVPFDFTENIAVNQGWTRRPR